MKNVFKFLGIIAIVAVIGFSACSSGGAGGGGTPTPAPSGDTWTNVTSFSQVNGTWKAPSTVSGKIEGINVTQNFTNYTVTFNSNTKTMTVSGVGTTSFSGGNIEELWPAIKEAGGFDYLDQFDDLDGVTVTVNDAKHSYTMTYDNFSQTLTDSDLADTGFQINQNGTKLKVDSGMGEIIYTKQ